MAQPTLGDADRAVREALLWHDPVQNLATLAAIERTVAATRERLVEEARSQGASWETIAAALGVSRQAAWQRYGRS